MPAQECPRPAPPSAGNCLTLRIHHRHRDSSLAPQQPNVCIFFAVLYGLLWN